MLDMAGCYDPNRILGVTTLDVVRAAAFIGEINGVDPRSVSIPVIGGHSGVTIIPVLSQSQPAVKLTSQDQIKALTGRIQEAGTEVVKAKAGGGSATLSMAFAGARLAGAVLRGLKGESNVVECAYIKSDITESPYFANPVVLGKNGVEKNLGFGTLNAYEKELLKAAIPELLKNIKVGEEFVKNSK
ncbi:malate dehydrogenase, mitochondrial-like [Ostrinia furnacalis]|uniref:malate dehydrogenase, mitochondrial-like n=1 Tax=Ostrinia furnacalis TaxID=93504 RepID=UPI00103A61DA|nr:malate dehydrogenase, mitochondrial-like [Ostrinia furnacalis]